MGSERRDHWIRDMTLKWLPFQGGWSKGREEGLETGPGLRQQHPHGSANHHDTSRAWGRKTEADRYQSQVPSCAAGRAGPEELISWVVLRRVTLVCVASWRRMEGIHSSDSSTTVGRGWDVYRCWFAPQSPGVGRYGRQLWQRRGCTLAHVQEPGCALTRWLRWLLYLCS